MKTSQPNILFIITDQQRYDTIAALGYDHMDTPNLDGLARSGVHFTQCHVAGASCVPARSSLFTGYYPHTTGILKNADDWRHTWVENLADAGYKCINVGKMHVWPLDTPAGYHQRYIVENKDRFYEGRYFYDDWDRSLAARGIVKQQRELYRQRPDYRESMGAFTWELPADAHSDNHVADRATWWVKNTPKPEQPLFLQVGFPGPHPPYDPTPGVLAEYMAKHLPIREVKQHDLDSQPLPFKVLRQHNVDIDHDSVVHQLEPTPEARHRQRAHYLANVSMIDQGVGKLLKVLEEKGYLEDSIVIFTSDHGECLGDHGHIQKWTMYEQVTRVPMIISAPGRIIPGTQSDALIQQMDIVPWLLEQAQASMPRCIEAQSIAPAFSSPDWAGRDAVYCEQSRDAILTDAEFMTMVRTSRWKLVHFLGESYGQLFDLHADPLEETNLWDAADKQTVKADLLKQLFDWRIKSQLNAKDLYSDHR